MRKLKIARLINVQTDIILFDEPTAALDIEAAQVTRAMLMSLKQQNKHNKQHIKTTQILESLRVKLSSGAIVATNI